MAGRVPSGSRNSLPRHVGIASSSAPGDGSSRRTLAAGASTTKPSSSAPTNRTRTIRGPTRSADETVTVRKRGGSRRSRADPADSVVMVGLVALAGVLDGPLGLLPALPAARLGALVRL